MRFYIYLTTFVAGLTSLAVEMTSSRLLERTFGMTNLVWASIIGLILVYLALGYLIGGRIADRYPYPKMFYQLLIWASITTLLIPVFSRPVLQMASQAFDDLQAGAMIGSFVSVMFILIVPITLLGTASPFAIRLLAHQTRGLGTTAGKLYAISTFGSFLGTFIPVLILIPTIGTYRSFIAFGSLMLIVSLVGLWLSGGWRLLLVYLWAVLLIPILLIFGISGPDRNTPGLVYETESAYNYIQVTQKDGNYLLMLNDGQGIQSIYNPDHVGFRGPWDFVMVSPFFNAPPFNLDDVKNLAIIGLAGGTTVRQVNQVFGSIPIDGFELDPQIIEVAQIYFGLTQPNLNVILQDGRWGLMHNDKDYSIISIDAYKPPYIPWHLTTLEFFQLVHDHLTSDGVMVINVARTPDNRDLVNALASTIHQVFPSVYIVDVPKTWNSMIYATVQPTSKSNLTANYDYLRIAGADQLLLNTMELALENFQSVQPLGTIFTDDLAPVEWITDRMILEFITSGRLETW